ncbi:hypothetical protein [Frigoribacterium sp. PhB116]|uniref:hypothetical protein n=1 Tax=Frigoribacterium sp. PhB116 TaxID=2485174 RepID=UPI001061F38F|nr:hypothetical protein [Frigoribacterium sp. PhB116]TDT66424.1 hypothetical protein EDF20_1237 [Frigoribacterium sp. PhB116]
MTDPDELGGSAADRRFREALREGLAAAERESQSEAEAENGSLSEGRGHGGHEAGARGPATRRRGRGSGAAVPPRSRSEVFMDWAPLAVAVLAIGAVIGIALYGINGGDLGPW